MVLLVDASGVLRIGLGILDGAWFGGALYLIVEERGADQMIMATTIPRSTTAPMATPTQSHGNSLFEEDGGASGGGAGGSTLDVMIESTSMAAGAPNIAVVAAGSV